MKITTETTAHDVAELRIIGTPETAGILISVLERLADGLPVETVGLELLKRSAPYQSRREPGRVRYYLTAFVRSRRGEGE